MQAYMSFDPFVDNNDGGQLTNLAAALSAEIKIRGQDFPILLSHRDVHWGEDPVQRIAELIDSVTFYIPIVTPSFFRDDACREQILRFAERERRLGRSDLILPLLYVGRGIEDEAQRWADDEVGRIVFSHQPRDCRHLRRQDLSTSYDARTTLDSLASQLCDALDRVQGGGISAAGSADAPSNVRRDAAADSKPTKEADKHDTAIDPEPAADVLTPPTAADEIVPLIVDRIKGPYRTVLAAVQEARPGSLILIRPGEYTESVRVDKPITLVGDGTSDQILLHSDASPAIVFEAPLGRITNLTLRQTGTEPLPALDILQGYVDVEGCQVTSVTGSGVVVHSGADPRLRRNRLVGCKKAGIIFTNGARGTLEENEITENHSSAIGVADGAAPTIRQNRIFNNDGSGIYLSDGAGTISENELAHNKRGGIRIIGTSANPSVRHNRIHDNVQSGILVGRGGQGLIDDNSIFNNGVNGVAVRQGGNPTLTGNRIYGNHEDGIDIYDQGLGTFEDNEIFSNLYCGLRARTGANPVVRRNRFHRNMEDGVTVASEARGLFDRNEVFDNQESGIWVGTGCNPVIRGNDIHDANEFGILARLASGNFEENVITRARGIGILVSGGDSTFVSNRVENSREDGIRIEEGATGLFEGNEILRNAGDGLVVANTDSAVIRANRIAENNGAGIRVERGGDARFEANALEENHGGNWVWDGNHLVLQTRPADREAKPAAEDGPPESE